MHSPVTQGDVLPTAKKVSYVLDIKRVVNRGAVVGFSDADMFVVLLRSTSLR